MIHSFPLDSAVSRRGRRLAGRGILFLAATLFLAVAPVPATPAAGLAFWRTSNPDGAEPGDFPARTKGRRAMADGITDSATTFFREYREAAATREPAYSDASLFLLQAYFRQGRTEDAIQVLAERDAAKTHGLLHDQDLVEKLRYWRGILLSMQGRWAEARDQFQPVAAKAEHKDTQALALQALGNACARLGDWKAAANACERFLAEFPKNREAPAVTFNLFKCALGLHDFKRAETILADALAKLPPENVRTPTLYRTLLLLAAGDNAAAWKQFDLCARGAGPEPPPADFWLAAVRVADSLTVAGRPADAQIILQSALTTAPSPADLRQTRMRLADVLLAQGKEEAAAALLEAFRKEFPGKPETPAAALKLGDILRKAGNYLAAADRFREITADTSLATNLRYEAGLRQAGCLREVGQYAAASRAFEQAAALAVTPDRKAETLMQAADAAFAIGSFGQAAAWFATAADLAPDTPAAENARFNQAMAKAREGQAAKAAELFAGFLKTYPASKLSVQAELEQGVALRDSGNTVAAAATLLRLAQNHPADALAPQALLDAHLAEVADGRLDQANRILGQFLEKYPASPLAPRALYERARLAFRAGRAEPALADCRLFLERHPQSPLAADVLMWIGDYQLTAGLRAQAEATWLDLAARFPASPLAPQAILEAAKSALLRQDTTRAQALTDQLQKDLPAGSAAPAFAVQAELLRGDILAEQGRYADALTHFRKAAETANASPLTATARARSGDMLYALADGGAKDDPNLLQAAEIFSALSRDPAMAPGDRENARYRLGKVREKLTQNDQAVAEYLAVLYEYEDDLKAGRPRDWTGFVRAGFDAARLLTLQERWEEAARIYQRVAAAGLPESPEAALKAKELRAAHHLDR